MDLVRRLARAEERLDRIERALSLAGIPPPPEPSAGGGAGGYAPSATAAPVPPAVAPMPVVEPLAEPRPAHVPPPLPRLPRAQPVREPVAARSRSAPPRPKGDLERVVGVAVVGRVGIASLLLAASYFAKLAWDAVSPEARVAGIYALAAALVGAGAFLRSRVAPRFTAILWGGGVAAAYLAGVVAKLRYDLVGPLPAALMLVAACALGQGLARIARLPALAHVALAGALAAPLLVGSPEDSRTVLLVYLLALHAWAVATERRFGWSGARAIALAGTVVVGGVWLGNHGAPDVSTYLHLHVYVAGLLFPEIVDGLSRRPLSEGRVAVMLTAVTLVEAGATVWAFDQGALCAFPLIAGFLWVALAAAWHVVNRGVEFPGVRALVRLGGCLLAVGALRVVAGDLNVAAAAPWEARLSVLAAVGVGLVLLCRRLRAGDGPALVASLISVLCLARVGAPTAWTLVAMAAPAALVLSSRAGAFRLAGLALLLVDCFVGIARWDDPNLLLCAFAAAAAVTALAATLARKRADGWLLAGADLAALALAIVWTGEALGDGAFASVPTPFANHGTAVAAILLAGVLARRPWVKTVVARPMDDLRAVAAAVVVALVSLAGWREVVSATHAMASADAPVALRALYVAAISAAALVVSRAKGASWLAFPALAGFALAAGMACSGLGHVESTAWAVLGVGGTGLLAASAALGAGGESRVGRLGGLVVLATLVAAWPLVGWLRFLPADAAFANARFGCGLVLLVALFAARRGFPEPLRSALTPWWAGLLALSAFAVGWVDLRAALAGLADPHARDALASVYGILAAATALTIGFRTKSAHFRWLALAGFGAVVLKVGLHDLASVDTPFRVLVTGALGLVLLLAAYAYARRSRPAASDDTVAPPE